MELAGSLGEDALNGNGVINSLNTEKRTDLSEETGRIVPRKPETSNHTDVPRDNIDPTLSHDLADHPEFKGIDLKFVRKQEGNDLKTVLYIPKERESGKVIGKSGATIGHGVDLGQMNAAELQRLGDQYDLPQDLIDKLKPYTNKIKSEAAAFLEANPLTISKEEARQLSAAKYTDTMVKLRTNVDKHLGNHGKFENLPDPVRTVVYDLGINYGPNFLDKHHRFRARLQEGMIDELRNYGGPQELEQRRNDEARKLEDLLNIWQS